MNWASQIVTLFLLAGAVLHLARLIWHIEVVIGGWTLPGWISAPAVVVALILAWGLRRETAGRDRPTQSAA
jgi:hypothetical protein